MRLWASRDQIWSLASLLVGVLLWPALASGTDLIPSRESPAPMLAPVVSDVYDPNRFEVRVGALAHGIGSVESGTVDFTAEFVGPRLWLWQHEWFSFVIPRPHLGGSVNLSGRTSSAYAGLLWSTPLPYRFFAEAFFDGAVHNGELNNAVPGHAELGCRTLFHVGGSLGYSISPPWNVMLTFEHLSNGNSVFGTGCIKNQGLNNYGVKLGHPF